MYLQVRNPYVVARYWNDFIRTHKRCNEITSKNSLNTIRVNSNVTHSSALTHQQIAASVHLNKNHDVVQRHYCKIKTSNKPRANHINLLISGVAFPLLSYHLVTTNFMCFPWRKVTQHRLMRYNDFRQHFCVYI